MTRAKRVPGNYRVRHRARRGGGGVISIMYLGDWASGEWVEVEYHHDDADTFQEDVVRLRTENAVIDYLAEQGFDRETNRLRRDAPRAQIEDDPWNYPWGYPRGR